MIFICNSVATHYSSIPIVYSDRSMDLYKVLLFIIREKKKHLNTHTRRRADKKTVRSQLKMLVALATPPDLLLAIEVRTCITIIKLNRTYFLRVTPLFPDLSLSNGCILSFPAEAES